MTEHKVVYRGVEIPGDYCHPDADYIDGTFLAGIDAALDAREALDTSLELGYGKLARSEYEYYRDESDPQDSRNYYDRIDSRGNATSVFGEGMPRKKSSVGAKWVRENCFLTPENQVPAWAKVD